MRIGFSGVISYTVPQDYPLEKQVRQDVAQILHRNPVSHMTRHGDQWSIHTPNAQQDQLYLNALKPFDGLQVKHKP